MGLVYLDVGGIIRFGYADDPAPALRRFEFDIGFPLPWHLAAHRDFRFGTVR